MAGEMLTALFVEQARREGAATTYVDGTGRKARYVAVREGEFTAWHPVDDEEGQAR